MHHVIQKGVGPLVHKKTGLHYFLSIKSRPHFGRATLSKKANGTKIFFLCKTDRKQGGVPILLKRLLLLSKKQQLSLDWLSLALIKPFGRKLPYFFGHKTEFFHSKTIPKI